MCVVGVCVCAFVCVKGRGLNPLTPSGALVL